MDKHSNRTDPRSHYEAVTDVKYANRLMLITGRFLRRMDKVLTGAQLLLGTAAVGGLIATKPTLATVAGVLIAVLSLVQILWEPAIKAHICEQQRKQWAALLGVASELELNELDKRIAAIRAETTPEIDLLRVPAYNQVMLEISRSEYQLPESRWQRFMSAIS
ncbi:hypothetical protein HPT27_10505 [Permianibacter sp. IMCC34836]|uniref:hypothetical protein n=1 Tax=Permianibacter fluminis TaxID=2738515 RepID=UPI001553EECB|nr:hypothetical protein [Permianibacter fluminis]NQD37459.1 hypothetical protein [Permianibacter fluminis]